jgi:hexokinase
VKKTHKNKVQAILDEVGFYRVAENLDAIALQGQLMAKNAGTAATPAFEAFPSFIPVDNAAPECPCLLTIDIGGTSTKAGVRLTENGYQEWKLLFELKNLDLKDVQFQDNAFDAFCRLLANHIERGLVSAGVPKEDVSACGVVWSNAMKNKPWDNHGVTGIITQLEKYKKGEWFNAGLSNGRDIGQDFLTALRRRKLPIEKILISNDTALTLKATPGAAAGMVASTGLNATLLKSASELGIGENTDLLICNAEMGGRFILNSDLITPFDKISATQTANTIESLTTGNFLPLLFTAYIFSYKELGLNELAPIKEQLDHLEEDAWGEFRSKDLSLLLHDQSFFLRRRTKRKIYNDAVLDTLVSLTEELIVRSAQLCAIVAASSVANLPLREEAQLISLDSRLAREIPLFWQVLLQNVEQKRYFGQKLELNLVQPIELPTGKISVPMIGVAHGVDSLIKARS